jgi:hypothetical protein
MTEPLDHKINEINKQLFIKNSAPDVKDAIKIVLDNIIHIPHKTFIKEIEKNLEEVISYIPKDRPIFVYITSNDIENNKSSYWVYLLINNIVKDKYKEINLIQINNFLEVSANDIVLFIDDCIYSGEQMSITINKALKKLETNKIKDQIKFIVFTPYMSEKGWKRILNTFKTNLIKITNIIKINYIEILPLSTYLTMEDAIKILKYYKIIGNSVNKELEKYLIYFDHKLADETSILPYIFNGSVPNQQNLDIINEYNKVLREYTEHKINVTEFSDRTKKILENYVQFPLITYCESMKKDFIHFDDLCPVPPYKEEYNDFRVKVTAEKAEEDKAARGEERLRRAQEEKTAADKAAADKAEEEEDKAAEDKAEADKTEEQRKAEEKAAKLFKKLLIKTPIQSLDKLNNLLYQYFNMTK